jgi:hypothetical protein
LSLVKSFPAVISTIFDLWNPRWLHLAELFLQRPSTKLTILCFDNLIASFTKCTREHFCKATFHFGQIGSKRHLQTSKTTDANDEKCRKDANLMKEIEGGHFVVSFITGRSNFKYQCGAKILAWIVKTRWLKDKCICAEYLTNQLLLILDVFLGGSPD